jgi:hypothetical protein
MQRFNFKVNSSFLSWPSHPITVPKTQIDYLKLEKEGLDQGTLRVVCPDGTTVSGDMYSGTAGYGPYYQIRMVVPQNHSVLKLPIGSRLSVELERVNSIRWVRLYL